jgi:hypothetical protein
MSYVAEIASMARQVSAEEMAIALQKAQVSVLKEQMDVQALLQQQLATMIQDILPHLGNGVNITA